MAVLCLSILTAVLAQLAAAQQKDPLKDFCRRFGHQTALIDRRLYIDGGLINYNPLQQNPLNYTNTGLLYADLNVDNQGMPQEYANLSKPASAPAVEGGILWADSINKYFYLYGGQFYQSSPQPLSVWQYDVLYDNWTALNPDVSQAGISRASYGAGVVAQDIAKGFYYGGWLNNQSVPAFGANPVALSNMLQYDMLKNSWTNSTGPDSIGRAEGIMTYIPASDGGMLVYFGGVKTPYSNGSAIAQTLDEIFLYDLANAKWYTQKATGTIPEPRKRFCGGATWATDQSSYNIYIYGGAAVPEGVGFDDIYVLSIPSFTWIKWYPDKPGTGYPHHSLSCNVVDGAQMFVMGGSFPNSTACDVPTVFAFHNMDLGKQNPDNAKWALYRPNVTSYKVPQEIIAVVGGSANGGATKKSPSDGFDDRDLSAYFTRAYTTTARAATRAIPTPTKSTTPTPTGKSTPVGAIVGGAVGGGVFLLACIGAVIYFCMRIRKKKAADARAQQERLQAQYGQPKWQPQAQGPPPMVQEQPQPIYQLPGSEAPVVQPVELPDAEGQSHANKIAQYSYTPVSAASPPNSPPPPSSPPAPAYPRYSDASATGPSASQFVGYGQPQQQTYYPPPGQPAYVQQQYSPPQQYSSHQSYPPAQGYFPPAQAPSGGISPNLTPTTPAAQGSSPASVGRHSITRKDVPGQPNVSPQ